jgi:hypothetical protein
MISLWISRRGRKRGSHPRVPRNSVSDDRHASRKIEDIARSPAPDWMVQKRPSRIPSPMGVILCSNLELRQPTKPELLLLVSIP